MGNPQPRHLAETLSVSVLSHATTNSNEEPWNNRMCPVLEPNRSGGDLGGGLGEDREVGGNVGYQLFSRFLRPLNCFKCAAITQPRLVPK